MSAAQFLLTAKRCEDFSKWEKKQIYTKFSPKYK